MFGGKVVQYVGGLLRQALLYCGLGYAKTGMPEIGRGIILPIYL